MTNIGTLNIKLTVEGNSAIQTLDKAENKTKKFKSITDALNDSMKKHNKNWTELSNRGKLYEAILTKVVTKQNKFKNSLNKTSSSLKNNKSSLASLLTTFTKLRWMMVNVTMIAASLYGTFKVFEYGANRLFEYQRLSMLTNESTKELRTSIMSTTEAYGVSAKEGITSFTELVKSGFSATESINILNAALPASILGFTSLDSAAKAVSQSIRIFGYESKDATKIAMELVNAANLGRIDVGELGTVFSYSASMARQLNIPLTDLLATTVMLANRGIQASKIGTGMRQVLGDMIKPSAEAGRVLSTIDLNMIDMLNDGKNVYEVLDTLKNKLGKFSAGEQTALLSKIFDVRALNIVNSLLNATNSEFKELQSAINDVRGAEWLNIEIKMSAKVKTGKLKESIKNVFSTAIEEMIREGNNNRQMIIGGGGAVISGPDPQEKINDFLKSNDDLIAKLTTVSERSGWTEEKIKQMSETLIRSGDEGVLALNNYLDSQLKVLDLQKQINSEITTTETKFTGGVEIGKLIGSTVNKTYSEAVPIFESFKTAYDKINESFGTGTEKTVKLNSYISSFLSLITDKSVQSIVQGLITDWTKNTINVEKNVTALSLWTTAMTKASSELSKIQKRISDYTKKIADANSTIGDLMNLRFTGETSFLEQIYQQELAIKREKLRMLELGDTAESVSDSIRGTTSSYDAWIESIDTSIKSLIRQGSSSGSNITGLLKQFQTERLGISQFESSSSSSNTTSDMENELEKLKLRYDINYGDMHHQVQLSEEMHKDEANGVASSSQQIITAISAQRSAIEEYTTKINNLRVSEKYWLDNKDFITEHINDLKGLSKSYNELELAALKAYDAEMKARNAGSSGVSSGSSGSSNNNYTYSLSSEKNLGMSIAPHSQVFPGLGLSTSHYATGGLVTSPTNALIGESGPELITPLTGPNVGNGGGMSFNITINGSNTTTEQQARELGRLIKNELKRY